MAIPNNPYPHEVVKAVQDLQTAVNGLATVASSGKSSDLNNDAGFITSNDVPTFTLDGTVLTIHTPS